jgi:hypothetical protein
MSRLIDSAFININVSHVVNTIEYLFCRFSLLDCNLNGACMRLLISQLFHDEASDFPTAASPLAAGDQEQFAEAIPFRRFQIHQNQTNLAEHMIDQMCFHDAKVLQSWGRNRIPLR